MQPIGIHHVSVNVADAAESIPFYTEVLGGVLRSDRPDFPFGGAWIDFGPSQVHLIESEVPPNLGQHFALRVRDLDAAVAELRAGGLAVQGPKPVGTARQAFVEDPSGNRIELHEPGAATTG